VLVDVVPGVRAPVAAVGIAEKGSVSLTLTVEAPGGHASMPPDRTAIGILSRAIERLQAEPFPASLGGATGALFDFVGPEAELPYRAALANRWLFGPLIKRRLMASPSTAAEVRTTVAATQIEGGTKRNALPGRARATLNVRILPGWTVADVTDRVRRVVNDPRVRIAVSGDGTDPSPLAPVDSPGFQEIAVAIRQVYPDAVVAPYLVVGQTDGRHYTAITRNVYRFGPGRLGPLDLERLHGSNERIGVADYAAAVRFYAQLLRNATR
jgi:carboxypeptidase PM20D1